MRLLNPKKSKAVRSHEQYRRRQSENVHVAGPSSECGKGAVVMKRSLATFHVGCTVHLMMRNIHVGTAKLMPPCDVSGSEVFRRVLHGSSLSGFQKAGEDLVVIKDVRILPHAEKKLYPYRYGGVEEPAEVLSGLSTGLHVWDRQNMRPAPEKQGTSAAGREVLSNSSAGAGVSDVADKVGSDGKQLNVQHNGTVARHLERVGSTDAAGSAAGSCIEVDYEASMTGNELDRTPVESGKKIREGIESTFGSHSRERRDSGMDTVRGTEQLDIGKRSSEGEESRTDTNSMEMLANARTVGEEDEAAVMRNGECSNRPVGRESESSDAASISPTRKRAYTYIKRRPRQIGEEADLQRKRRRIAGSFTNDNIRNMKCCQRLDCFGRTDKSYLRAQVARVLKMTQDERRKRLEGMLDKELLVFLFNGKRVCATFLENAFGFSRYLQSRVKRTPASVRRYETTVSEYGSPAVMQRDSIICYLERLAESTGDIMPDIEEFHLPFFRKDDVYKDFCKEYAVLHERKDMTYARRSEPPTSSYFYSIWSRYCTHIKVRSTHRFTKCGDCERLRAALEEKRTDAKAATALKQKKREHNEMINRERREYAKKCQNAILYPEDYCSVVVDGADQSAFGLPHFRVSVKEARGHGIGVKLIGVLEHSPNKKVSLFLMTEQYETGANHIIEAVHRHLTLKSLSGRLPRTLYVQADNCQRENKNQFFFTYCESLVAWGVFCEVYVSFLPIGHTHSDIDQVFSRTSTRLRHQDAVTMEELMTELSKSYTPQPHVVRMHGIANFSGLCKEQKCSSTVTGFTEYRYFWFVRSGTPTNENERHYNTNCLVRLSCDDEWEPLRGEDEPGFLMQLPDLRLTPPTVVKAPDNLDEINKRLRSEENRIKRTQMKDLEELRDEVYKSGEEPFHWNLSTCLELNGRFAKNRETVDGSSDIETGEDSPEEDLDYELNELVATKADSDDESVPFWIARIVEVEKNESGVIARLHVHWFEMYRGNSVYSGKYRPANTGKGRSKQRWITVISVNTVLHKFSCLTRGKHLSTTDRKSIWQALH